MQNRIIKFRAWDGFKMYEPCVWMGKEYIPIRDSFVETHLMQYTGLKDKNGKEVYSGDLYEVAGNKVYEVRYVDKMQVQSGGFETFGACFVLWISDELFFPFDEYAMEHGKVIGNIYETPTP